MRAFDTVSHDAAGVRQKDFSNRGRWKGARDRGFSFSNAGSSLNINLDEILMEVGRYVGI